MAAQIYKCSKCGKVCEADEIVTNYDYDTGYTLDLCPNCDALETLEAAEMCNYCGNVYLKAENSVFTYKNKKICRDCAQNSFNAFDALRHVCRCRNCIEEFVLRATDTLDTISRPTQKMIDIVGQYAREVICRNEYNPPWLESEMCQHFVKCLKDTCVGAESDYDHYLSYAKIDH